MDIALSDILHFPKLWVSLFSTAKAIDQDNVSLSTTSKHMQIDVANNKFFLPRIPKLDQEVYVEFT
jgi:hypothetical protein